MNKERRQIIYLWNYLEWGGAQIYFLAIMKEARADWDIVVILPRQSSSEIVRFIDQTGARCEFIEHHIDSAPADSIMRKLQRQYRRVRAEAAIFKHLLRYDLRKSILHIEIAPWQSWILLTALSLRRANIFATLHNALPRGAAWREAIWKLRLQFASRLPGFHIFTSNEDTKNKLRGWVAEKFWQNIKVTYTCVNPLEIKHVVASSPTKSDIRQNYNIDNDKFVVLCVGQFIDRKGRWVFLEAAKIISENHTDALFVWLTPKLPDVGEQTRIDKYGLKDNFRLVLSETVGSGHEDVLRFFRIADVFALASFVEGLPIALLEAMSLGVPSISTNVYAIPEALKHKETGILIEAGDAAALADAILLLKKDNDLRSRLSQQGSEFVLHNFDERVASRIALDAYRECFENAQ
jgi:glycosyltransferase involved in cell wall biosynthesis